MGIYTVHRCRQIQFNSIQSSYLYIAIVDVCIVSNAPLVASDTVYANPAACPLSYRPARAFAKRPGRPVAPVRAFAVDARHRFKVPTETSFSQFSVAVQTRTSTGPHPSAASDRAEGPVGPFRVFWTFLEVIDTM